MEIVNHRLKGPNVKFVPTEKHGGKISPDTIVIHYTASSTLESAVETLAKSDRKASAHVVIGKKGEVVQIVDFNVKAWHAGISAYGGREYFNNFSIGIELENPGWLVRTGNVYRTSFGTEIDSNDVVQARHRNPETRHLYWCRFTEAQIRMCEELCGLLMKTYPIEYIVGHEEIAPGRKSDPGPAFPLDHLRDHLLGGDRSQDGDAGEMIGRDGIISASSLNIRATPSTMAEKVAQPLKKGQKVKILKAEKGWYRVRTEIEGWVYGDYVEPK